MKEIIARINKTFENKVRLGVMSALMVNSPMDFASMKKLLEITDGNLSSNISVLETLGYLEVNKSIVGKKVSTSFTITEEGRKSFNEHLTALEELIGKSRNG